MNTQPILEIRGIIKNEIEKPPYEKNGKVIQSKEVDIEQEGARNLATVSVPFEKKFEKGQPVHLAIRTHSYVNFSKQACTMLIMVEDLTSVSDKPKAGVRSDKA